ncbi:hypothetical protein PG996_002898 [Apiospora saccharicola]|uniref:Uncharacterized protein n=1 Tax=Apiospora saccharicola TaxID=335842 RepID=A0ABR1WKU7_9PEZI
MPSLQAENPNIFVSSTHGKVHVSGLLRMLFEAADLPARFAVDLCDRQQWGFKPTTLSLMSTGSDHSERSLVLRYGCYFSTQARISFVLQIIHSSKTQDLYCVDFPKELRENLERHFRSDIGLAQDPMFANVLMLEYVLRSCQNKITDWRKKLRVILTNTPIKEKKQTTASVEKQAEDLHDLSVKWHSMHRDLEYIQQHTDKLLDLQEKIGTTKSENKCTPQATPPPTTYAISKTSDVSWLASSSLTSSEPTSTFSWIADQTRRESMAMFTLALVTVLFLPGTFVPLKRKGPKNPVHYEHLVLQL